MTANTWARLSFALALAAAPLATASAQSSSTNSQGQTTVQPQSSGTIDNTNGKPGTQSGQQQDPAGTTGSISGPAVDQDSQSGKTLQQKKGKPDTQSGAQPTEQQQQ
ncbi:MAG: hypothetical protein U1E46_14880 [Hyphomicrobiales bacterium]